MLGVIGALVVVLGAMVVATAPAQSFGWLAHAPLSNDVYTSPHCPWYSADDTCSASQPSSPASS